MKKQSLLLPVLLLIFLMVSCNPTGEKKSVLETNSSDTLAKKTTALNDSLLKPQQLLSTKSGLKVPVYAFEGFEQAVLKRNEENITYVVNFWATWCKPCVAELPFFLELEKMYKDKKVKFIFVSLDFMNNLELTLIPFLDDRKISSEIIVLDQKDADVWMEKIDKNWSGSIPATLIYNTKNRIFVEDNFSNTKELEDLLKPLL
jgi:thiol-disulfide isomerase/thioredoxin